MVKFIGTNIVRDTLSQGVSALDYIALFKNFTYTEYPNYRLDTIAQLELGRGKIEYDGNLDQLFRDDIEKFIEYNLVDVELVVDLDKKLQFIDLSQPAFVMQATFSMRISYSHRNG